MRYVITYWSSRFLAVYAAVPAVSDIASSTSGITNTLARSPVFGELEAVAVAVVLVVVVVVAAVVVAVVVVPGVAVSALVAVVEVSVVVFKSKSLPSEV